MRTIIRIEHSTQGLGIWQAENEDCVSLCNSFSFYSEFSKKHNDFPTPREDNMINRVIKGDEFCAFKSIEQLQQWIEKDWWSEIFDKGFKVLMIDVITCVEGEYQILYKKEDILQTKDISSLFE